MSKRLTCMVGILLWLAPHQTPGRAETQTGAAGDWRWESSKSTCHLERAVPGFGSAAFVRHARQQTRLELRSQVAARSRGIGTLYALPPAWRHDQEAMVLGRLWRRPGDKPFRVTPDVTHRVLTKLSQGMSIGLRFRDADDAGATRSIEISPLRAGEAIEQFRHCEAALPAPARPVIEEIQLYFAVGSATLNADARQLLEDAVSRLQHHPAVTGLEVIGHADASGPALRNEALSRERMLRAVNYLIAAGVPPGIISSAYRGEADTDRATNWRHNRRVAIRFQRQET